MDIDYYLSDCGSEANSLFAQEDSDSAPEFDENNNNILKKTESRVLDHKVNNKKSENLESRRSRSKSSEVKQQKLEKLEQYDYEREKDDSSSLYSSCFNNLPLNRSSLRLFRRRSSGINVILDNDEPSEGPSHLCSGHVRNSYDVRPSGKPPQPPPPSSQASSSVAPSSRLRLSSLLQEQMKVIKSDQYASGRSSETDASPSFLNNAFFKAINKSLAQNKITEPQSSPVINYSTSTEGKCSDRWSEQRKSYRHRSMITDVTGEDSISQTSRSFNAATTRSRSSRSKSKTKAESSTSAKELPHINLTIQISGTKINGIRSTECTQKIPGEKPNSSKKENSSLNIELSKSDITKGVVSRISKSSVKMPTAKSTQRLACKSKSSIDSSAPKNDGDFALAKTTSASVVLSKEFLKDKEEEKDSDTEAQECQDSTEVETENPSQENSLITSAICLAADSVTTFFKIITNIVPAEGRPPTIEEIEAKQDTFGVCLMNFLGLSKETSTNIYQEACDEIETLRDVSLGTADTIADLVKWVLGRREARERMKYRTKAFCSVNSEVDMNSDIWKRLNKYVESSVDPADANELEALAELEKLSAMEKGESTISPVMHEHKPDSEESIPDAYNTLAHTLNNEGGYLQGLLSKCRINPESATPINSEAALSINRDDEPSKVRSLSCIPEEDEGTSSGGKSRPVSRDIFEKEIIGTQLTTDSYAGLLKASLSKVDSETPDDSNSTETEEEEFDGQITDVEEEYYFIPSTKSAVKEDRQETGKPKNLLFLDDDFSDYIVNDEDGD